MQVIFLKDLAGVGQKGSVKNVSDGYAMNFLIPQKIAEMADAGKLAALEKAQKEAQANALKKEGLWEKQARLLTGSRVTVRTDANEKGQLYQQLPASVIVERIKKEVGVEVTEDSIVFKEPIKSLGRADVTIRLGKERVPLPVFIERKVLHDIK